MGAEQQVKINRLRKELVKSKRLNVIGGFLLMVIFAWIVVGEIVFAFRHPWATETERFIYTFDVLKFNKVPYEQMRPRE